MASSFVKAKMIANRDATPSVLTDPIVSRGSMQEAFGADNLPASSDNGSFVKCFSVPSSARLSSLNAYAAAAINTTSLDIGVWFPTNVQKLSGDVIQSAVVAGRLIQSSAFAVAITVPDTTGLVETDAMGTLTAHTIPQRSQPLWQKLGLQADPMCDLDMGFVVRTVNTAAGYVGLRARFVR